MMKKLQNLFYTFLIIVSLSWLIVDLYAMISIIMVNSTALILFNLACISILTLFCLCMYRAVIQEKLQYYKGKEEVLTSAIKITSESKEDHARRIAEESLQYERIKKLFDELKSIEISNTPVTIDDQIEAFDSYYKQAVKTYELIKQTLNK